MHTINAKSIAWALYCPAWANVNHDGCPVIQINLKTGGCLYVSATAAAAPKHPDVYCELTPAQVKAALSNIDKEGCND